MCVDASGPPSFNLLNNLSLQMVVHFILVVLKSFVFKRKKVSLSYYGLVRLVRFISVFPFCICIPFCTLYVQTVRSCLISQQRSLLEVQLRISRAEISNSVTNRRENNVLCGLISNDAGCSNAQNKIVHYDD